MKRLSLISILLITTLTVFGQTQTACTQTVSGEVRDGISTEVLVGAEVLVTNNSGTVVARQTIKEDGAFSITLNCEETYTIEGKQEEYTAESKTFTTTNENKKVLKLIILLDKGNIDFVTDGAANAKTIDSVAKAEVVTPEVKPDIVVEKLEVASEQQDVVNEQVITEETVKESKTSNVLTIQPIYFDYESSWLNQKAKNDLQKIITLLKQNPKMTLQCAGHTDAKGASDYNQWMSDRRAKRAIDYLVAAGISASRLSAKGFGETKLINDCTNEKECTDQERAINRRTEFVIVKM